MFKQAKGGFHDALRISEWRSSLFQSQDDSTHRFREKCQLIWLLLQIFIYYLIAKKCQNSKQLYGFWQDKNFAKSYKFVTKMVTPKYFYFLILSDKIKSQNISIKTAVHKCSKAGLKTGELFQWKYKQWMFLLQPLHMKYTSCTCQHLLTNVCTARIGSKIMLGITIKHLTLPNCANF